MRRHPIHKRKKKEFTSSHHDSSLSEEFLEMVNSKLKKSEKDIWMVHDRDHLFENRPVKSSH